MKLTTISTIVETIALGIVITAACVVCSSVINNTGSESAKELSVEVSINGTPHWGKVHSNDVIHVVIDDNKITTITNYANH